MLTHQMSNLRRPSGARGRAAIATVGVGLVMAACGSEGATSVRSGAEQRFQAEHASACADLGGPEAEGFGTVASLLGAQLVSGEELRVWEAASSGAQRSSEDPPAPRNPGLAALHADAKVIACFFDGDFQIPTLSDAESGHVDRAVVIVSPNSKEAFTYAVGPGAALPLTDIKTAAERANR